MTEVLNGLTPSEFLLLVLSGALLLHLTLRAVERRWAAWRRRRLLRRAGRGERKARKMLLRLGYVIEAEQPAQDWPVVAGQRCEQITLRADYLVRRGKRRYVAEVKTGDLVASIRHAPTRRQLLEYQLAYRTHGVLLVDVLANEIISVCFPRLER